MYVELGRKQNDFKCITHIYVHFLEIGLSFFLVIHDNFVFRVLRMGKDGIKYWVTFEVAFSKVRVTRVLCGCNILSVPS